MAAVDDRARTNAQYFGHLLHMVIHFVSIRDNWTTAKEITSDKWQVERIPTEGY